jgi:membrane protein implicated in regulation of membrane protease activity
VAESIEKSTNLRTQVVIWGAIIVVLAFLGWGLLKRGESRPRRSGRGDQLLGVLVR